MLREWIEKAISERSIRYFDYNEFSDFGKLGEGGFGLVYKAEWKDGGLTVALKCLKEEAELDEKTSKSFIHELKLLRFVSFHPNINHFYGITRDLSSKHYMVLQFARGGNLRKYLAENFSRLLWTDKFRIAKEITQGLTFLHKHDIIHRDLHSKNILVDEGRMMIADLGLSKYITEISRSSSHIHGMPAYIEPELLRDSSYKCDKRSDIYSLGVIFWEISSGKPPFQSATIYTTAFKIFQGEREKPVEGTPLQYRKLYERCWNGDPYLRPEIKSILGILNQLIFEPSHHDIIQDLSEIWFKDAISELDIEHYDFNEFSNFQKVNPEMYKCEWKGGVTVMMQKTEIDENLDKKDYKEFVKELKVLLETANHPNIIGLYGITKDDSYYMILQYANDHNLRHYLSYNYPKLLWSDKLRIAKEIAEGLIFLHENKIIHLDLNDINIMVHEGRMLISGFRLARKSKSAINSASYSAASVSSGVVAFIDPECFVDISYRRNYKSDVYSFGVILWEISSGRQPFKSEVDHSMFALVLRICQGSREEPVDGTPSQYCELYKQCWDSNHEQRPNMKLALRILNELISDNYVIL